MPNALGDRPARYAVRTVGRTVLVAGTACSSSRSSLSAFALLCSWVRRACWSSSSIEYMNGLEQTGRHSPELGHWERAGTAGRQPGSLATGGGRVGEAHSRPADDLLHQEQGGSSCPRSRIFGAATATRPRGPGRRSLLIGSNCGLSLAVDSPGPGRVAVGTIDEGRRFNGEEGRPLWVAAAWVC